MQEYKNTKSKNTQIQHFFSKTMNAGLAAKITDAGFGRREQMTTQRACTLLQTLRKAIRHSIVTDHTPTLTSLRKARPRWRHVIGEDGRLATPWASLCSLWLAFITNRSARRSFVSQAGDSSFFVSQADDAGRSFFVQQAEHEGKANRLSQIITEPCWQSFTNHHGVILAVFHKSSRSHLGSLSQIITESCWQAFTNHHYCYPGLFFVLFIVVIQGCFLCYSGGCFLCY